MSYLAQTGKNCHLYHREFLVNNSLEDTIDSFSKDLNITVVDYFECGLDEDFAFENSKDFIECVSFNCLTNNQQTYYLRLYEDGSFNVFLSHH